jgi:hypothetical protein
MSASSGAPSAKAHSGSEGTWPASPTRRTPGASRFSGTSADHALCSEATWESGDYGLYGPPPHCELISPCAPAPTHTHTHTHTHTERERDTERQTPFTGRMMRAGALVHTRGDPLM